MNDDLLVLYGLDYFVVKGDIMKTPSNCLECEHYRECEGECWYYEESEDDECEEDC